MQKIHQILFLLMISLTKFGCCQVINSWSQPLSATAVRPTFIVQGVRGSAIQGSVTVSDQQSYVVYFYRQNEYYPNTPAFQFITYTGSSNFSSMPIDATGFWRIEVLPANLNQNFLILVTVNNPRGSFDSYVDVARSQKLFVTYFSQGQNCGFKVSGINSGQERDILIELYGGNDSLDFVKQNRIFSNAGLNNNQYNVSCIAQYTGFYYIFISITPRIMPLLPRVFIQYQSNNYPCPAASIFQDSNQNFPTCLQLNSDAAFPCTYFDYSLNRCTRCAANFIIENGNCYKSIDCGVDLYFHEGSCYSIIQNCVEFQLIGGYCKKCNRDYILSSFPQGQKCNPITSSFAQKNNSSPQNFSDFNNQNPSANSSNSQEKNGIECQSGTYFFNGLCALIPSNCRDFDSNLRICINCYPRYTLDLVNLGCKLANVICLPSHTNIGDNCVPYPQNCGSTNSWGNCTVCLINYVLNNSTGKCKIIQCGQRQFLSNGTCQSVHSKCDTFNTFNGRCLSCLNNYLLDNTGNCNSPQYNKQIASNGCQPRQYKIGGYCYAVDPACNAFDLYTGNCLSCIDSKKLLDKSTGKCLDITDICDNRYYLDPITKTCLPVNQFCATYDPSTGNCLACNMGLTLFRGGCVSFTPCSLNQYRNQDGICRDADPNCDGVDQVTGGCIGCKTGYQLNEGGICCFSQNYLLSAACKNLLSKNCISQRPNFLNCQKCQIGYSLQNGVFGRCKKIQ